MRWFRQRRLRPCFDAKAISDLRERRPGVASALVQTREDFWAEIQRLAGEVDWRISSEDDSVWYVEARR